MGCLGYLDETLNPPEWTCEDPCVEERDGFLCGVTNHFTNFALLLEGEVNGKSGGCSSFSGDFITGSYIGDLLLSMAFVILAIIVVLFVWTCLTHFPPLQKFVFGKEGARIKHVRGRQAAFEM